MSEVKIGQTWVQIAEPFDAAKVTYYKNDLIRLDFEDGSHMYTVVDDLREHYRLEVETNQKESEGTNER